MLGRLLAVGGGPTRHRLGLRTHSVTGVRTPSHSEEDSGVGKVHLRMEMGLGSAQSLHFFSRIFTHLKLNVLMHDVSVLYMKSALRKVTFNRQGKASENGYFS